MKIFKEAEVKKLLSHVTAEQMTFSRFVEILNEKASEKLKDKSDDFDAKELVEKMGFKFQFPWFYAHPIMGTFALKDKVSPEDLAFKIHDTGIDKKVTQIKQVLNIVDPRI